MKRTALELMAKWKDRPDRKPLVLEGARQVGKTWLMREFGRLYYDDVAEFNFDEDSRLSQIFAMSKKPEFIVEQLGIIRGKKIDPQKTLIIFDEIQECGDALNSLKYFNENAPEYAVVSAGSLLGVYLAKGQAHPVGQVNILNVNPLTFAEFLEATEPELYGFYQNIGITNASDNLMHDSFLTAYNKYLIIGGLPECVKTWSDTKDLAQVQEKQAELQAVYERDFSKHNGKVNPGRILMVFRNIAAQLAKENNKFVYGDVAQGARARNFEEAIEWLVTAGMVNRLFRAKKNEMPLKVYTDLSAFKLYMFDTGLLKYMAGIPNESIVLNDDFAFKGSLTENFVLQELKVALSNDPNYFTFDRYEIDFLIQDQHGDIIPVEVKAGANVSSASFNAYNERYSPQLRIRYSTLGYKKDDNLINIPLYLIGKTPELV